MQGKNREAGVLDNRLGDAGVEHAHNLDLRRQAAQIELIDTRGSREYRL
jgi:hypothetical protein